MSEVQTTEEGGLQTRFRAFRRLQRLGRNGHGLIIHHARDDDPIKGAEFIAILRNIQAHLGLEEIVDGRALLIDRPVPGHSRVFPVDDQNLVMPLGDLPARRIDQLGSEIPKSGRRCGGNRDGLGEQLTLVIAPFDVDRELLAEGFLSIWSQS